MSPDMEKARRGDSRIARRFAQELPFGCATKADTRFLQRLWMDCFGDTAEYTALYFDHSFDPTRVFVLREDEIAAMCITFPVQYVAEDGDERAGAYLYAVCTRPELRGKGLCRRLLQETEAALKAQGCTFTCLRAASLELTAMYEKLGYKTTFTNREFSFSAVGTSPARPRTSAAFPYSTDRLSLVSVSPSEYYALRQFRLRGGFVDYPPEALTHQALLGTLFSVDGGAAIGALERRDGKTILKEYLGDEALLREIATALDVETLPVRTPGDEPFAMAKSLTPEPPPSGYLAFAFD